MVGADRPNILVVDDEKYICNIIVEALSSEDYDIVSFSDPVKALEYVQQNRVDLVLSDLVMGKCSGVQILETTLATHSDATIILMTAHPTVQTAISVLKKGAYDFLLKPFRLESVKATVRRGLEHQRVVRENLHLKGQVDFLKVASAAGAEVDIEDFLVMVARSCQKEMAAAAVGIIEIDPNTGEPVRRVYESEEQVSYAEVLNDTSPGQFAYTKSPRPIIHRSQIEEAGQTLTRIVISQPIYARRKLLGVINVLIKSRFDQLTPGQIDVLIILANSAAAAIANQRLLRDLRTSYLEAIRGLANAIEARDECTAGHTDRVCKLAELTARHLGWDDERLQHLTMGCTLHDIGKIGVLDCILNKPGKLTSEERRRMQAHPELGLKIIHGIDLFRPAIPYIIAHHEWYDGSGYPKGLKGVDIPIEGRLLAVVDTFDAILSNRPYRRSASVDVAISELVKFKGTQFDPQIVDAFLEIIESGKLDSLDIFRDEAAAGETDRAAVSEKEPV